MRRQLLFIFITIWFLIASCSGLGVLQGGIAPAFGATPAEVKKASSPTVVPHEGAKAPETKPSELPLQAGKQPAAPQPQDVKATDVKSADPEKKSVLPSVNGHRNTVGCILPLSGRFAEVGNKALDAVILSSDIFNQRYQTPWKVVVADSGESADDIKKAVAYLADEASVMAILAVSGTSEAVEAAREAEKRKVPLVLISSKEGVTAGYEYVFQHFLTPSQQMQALARYALDRLNVAIFAVLYPDDEYGQEMARLFRAEIQKVGGKISKIVSYSKTQTDFSEQIFKLTGKRTDDSGKMYATTQEAKQRIFVDFEALFIPDSPLRLKMITSQLAFHDVKGIKLLGTSLWHPPDLLKKGVEYLEGAVFPDSFLSNGFLPETNDFVDVFYSAYSREPENIEALSYDTMEMILGVLEDEKVKTRADVVKALLAINRYSGATGSVYFRGNHVAQKSAFILKIQDGKLGQVR